MNFRNEDDRRVGVMINVPQIPDSWVITVLATLDRKAFDSEMFVNGNVNDRQISNLTDKGKELIENMWKQTVVQCSQAGVEQAFMEFMKAIPEMNKAILEKLHGNKVQ